VGLERGPLRLVSITEELLEWKISGSGSRKPRLTAAEIRRTSSETRHSASKPGRQSRMKPATGTWVLCVHLELSVYILSRVVGVRVTKLTGSSWDDRIYWHFGYNFL
jgi:hypothetical protein